MLRKITEEWDSENSEEVVEVPVATYNLVTLPCRMPRGMKRKKEMIMGVIKKKLKSSRTIQIFDTGEINSEYDRLLNETVLSDTLEKDIQKNTNQTENVKKTKTKKTPVIFICDICNRTFRTKYALKCHVNSHKGIKSFKCDQCLKCFFDDATLRCHIRKVHHKEARQCSCYDCKQKPDLYCCDMCEENFSCKDNLRRHLGKHTEQYKFTCAQCGVEFIEYKSYTCHLAVHEGTQSFVCPVCDVRYGKLGTLRKHSILHYKTRMSNENEVCCAVCCKVLPSKSTLKDHMKSHTKWAEKNDDILRIREAKKRKYFAISNADKHKIEKEFHHVKSDKKCEFKKSENMKENSKLKSLSIHKQQKTKSVSLNESVKSACHNRKMVKNKMTVKSMKARNSKKMITDNGTKSNDGSKKNSGILEVKQKCHYNLPKTNVLEETESSVVCNNKDDDGQTISKTKRSCQVQKTNANRQTDENLSLETKGIVGNETETDNKVSSKNSNYMEIMKAMEKSPTPRKRVIRSKGGDLLTMDIGFEYF